MSATDSDNSIDWLASDNEDNEESEQEADCIRNPSQTQPPRSPSPSVRPHLEPSDDGCRRSAEVKEGDSKRRKIAENCGWGSSPETFDSHIELCKAKQAEKTHDKDTRRALKRAHSFVESREEEEEEEESEDCKDKNLNSNMSDKDRFFTSKVRHSVIYSTSLPHKTWLSVSKNKTKTECMSPRLTLILADREPHVSFPV